MKQMKLTQLNLPYGPSFRIINSIRYGIIDPRRANWSTPKSRGPDFFMNLSESGLRYIEHSEPIDPNSQRLSPILSGVYEPNFFLKNELNLTCSHVNLGYDRPLHYSSTYLLLRWTWADSPLIHHHHMQIWQWLLKAYGMLTACAANISNMVDGILVCWALTT